LTDEKKKMVKIGIIGGSGFYALDRLQNVSEVVVATPFGATSAPIVRGEIVGNARIFIDEIDKRIS
jgi:purine nucleoside phosphorylase